MSNFNQRNIFIAKKAADERDDLYRLLKNPYRNSMRIWSYPLYLIPGFLIGFTGSLPPRVIGAIAVTAFIMGNAIFFEINKLRRRCERAIDFLIANEDVRINTSVNQLDEVSGNDRQEVPRPPNSI